MKSKQQIGNYIKSLREDSDMTIDELSKEFNVEQQTISNCENGKEYPDITLFDMLSSYFKISVEDIMECNEEKTLGFKKKYFPEICAKMYNLLKNKNCNLNDYKRYITTEFSNRVQEVFLMLENKLWSYNNDNNTFYEPTTNLEYDQRYFKEYFLVNGNWGKDTRFIDFLADKFDLELSRESIYEMAKSNNLDRFLVSYIGPISSFYPNDTKIYPSLDLLPYKVHPQVYEMRDISIKVRGEDIFCSRAFEILKYQCNIEVTYDFDQLVKLYEKDSYKRIEKYLNQFVLPEAWKCIDYLFKQVKIYNRNDKSILDKLKFALLEYITKLLITDDKASIISSISTFITNWKADYKELTNILFQTNNIDYITLFIDEFGLVPDDLKVFEIYAKNKNISDVNLVYSLIKRISKLENKYDYLENQIQLAINGGNFSRWNDD